MKYKVITESSGAVGRSVVWNALGPQTWPRCSCNSIEESNFRVVLLASLLEFTTHAYLTGCWRREKLFASFTDTLVSKSLWRQNFA